MSNLDHYAKWNLGGKHKWITKAIASKLPGIGSTGSLAAKDVKVYLKLFNPTGIGTWYVTEANLETGEAFGFVELHEGELGYFDLNELRAFRGRAGLPIERDEWFGIRTLEQVMEPYKHRH